MEEKAYLRCRAQVLGATSPRQAVGWGTVISSRKFLTCTHVASAAAADPNQELTIRFVGTRGEPEYKVKRTEVAYPRDSRHEFADICVLELVNDEFRDDIHVVEVCSDPVALNADLRGFGMSKDLPGGHGIKARRGEAKSEHRIEVSSDQADAVIRQGSSGTPLFLPDRGMVGMVVETQGVQTGLYVPVAVIARYVQLPTPSVKGIVESPPTKASSSSDLMLVLSDSLPLLDRKIQIAGLELSVIEAHRQGRANFACSIAGSGSDNPSHCRKRIEAAIPEFTRSAGNYFKAAEGQIIDAKLLLWPNEKRGFDHNKALERLLHGLDEELADVLHPFDDIGAIVEALNGSIVPRLFYSEIKASKFSPAHSALLFDWLNLLDRLNKHSNRNAFVHLLLFEFDDGLDDDSIEEAMVRFLTRFERPKGVLAQLLRKASEGQSFTEHPALQRLAQLGPVEQDEVKVWVDRVAERGRFDRSAGVAAQQHFGERFQLTPNARLRQIEAWANSHHTVEGEN